MNQQKRANNKNERKRKFVNAKPDSMNVEKAFFPLCMLIGPRISQQPFNQNFYHFIISNIMWKAERLCLLNNVGKKFAEMFNFISIFKLNFQYFVATHIEESIYDGHTFVTSIPFLHFHIDNNVKFFQQMENALDEIHQFSIKKYCEIGKLSQENVKLKEALEGNGRAMEEIKNVMAENNDENIRLKIENTQQKVENAKLEDNNWAMQRKIERIETYFPKMKKVLINRRALPAELLSKLFASLPMENAFDILAKMPNGILARNMRKMLKGIEMAMRNNKWNETQCGPKMEISEGGLVVKHSGAKRYNSVRVQLAIPKFNLNANKSAIAYFEVEILAISVGIFIGFCTQQFPLKVNAVGFEKNSIRIWHKKGIYIDKSFIKFGNNFRYLQQGDMIGIGIVYFPAISSIKCFATCNGQLLGKVDLPIKFANLQLFPAVTMYYPNDSIRANFGRDPWQYNPIPEHLAN